MSSRSVLTLAHVWDGWTEQGGDNHGQAVERFLAFVGLKPGQPWCAAWVSYVGWWGCYDYVAKRSYWPLAKTGGCQALYEDARRRGYVQATPEVGDLFVQWIPSLGRFAHCGFIVAVHADGSCTTLEGNTGSNGTRNGFGVFQRTRRFGPKDRFLRWKAGLPKV